MVANLCVLMAKQQVVECLQAYGVGGVCSEKNGRRV